MTQLYSTLVNHVNRTTYLCLVLAVLWSLVVIGLDFPHCTLDNINGSISSHHLMCNLASVPFLYYSQRTKEGQHMVLKQRIYSTQWKFELPGFTILGKDVSG